MKYVAIDIETTSLDPKNGAILQIGMAFDDLEDKSGKSLTTCELWVAPPPTMLWNTQTLVMNAGLAKKLLSAQEADQAVPALEIAEEVAWFFHSVGYDFLNDERATIAGKNFASFDLPFLNACIPYFEEFVTPHLSPAVIDPAFHFWQPGDTQLPGLQKCLDRAGIEWKVEHNALSDALAVVKLVRHIKFSQEKGGS